MRPAASAAAEFRDGRSSIPELLQATMSAIAEADGALNSFITLEDMNLLERQAKALQNELETIGPRGPLHGIPVGVKDVIDTKDLRTTGGSAALENNVPRRDARSVELLRAAGAIVVGKNNTHEFAFGVTTDNARFGQCRNPWNLDHIPGGSSGGSGAAVGGGLVLASLATDTGSSIRRPAAFCGAVGMKPRFGRVSRRGAMLLSWSLDHVGPIAATVSDAVAMLDALAGHDIEDSASRRETWEPLHPTLSRAHGVRLAGVPRRWIERHCDSGVARRFESACARLEADGIRLSEIDPPFENDLLAALRLISIAEANLAHEERYAAHGGGYSEELRTLIELGAYIPATHYLKAQQLRAKVKNWLEATFSELDVIVSPTMPTVAPPIAAHRRSGGKPSVIADASGIFCSLGALGGLPSISLPMGFSDGMPCGLLLTGPGRLERSMLRLAGAIEAGISAE